MDAALGLQARSASLAHKYAMVKHALGRLGKGCGVSADLHSWTSRRSWLLLLATLISSMLITMAYFRGYPTNAPSTTCSYLLRAVTRKSPAFSYSKVNAWNRTVHWFPQVMQCPTGWMRENQQLHELAVRGSLSQDATRWLVSVAVEAGVADRLTGLVTLLWMAILSNRTFTEYSYDPLPPFHAACDFPWINWTQPTQLPAAVVDPLKYTYKGVRGYQGSREYDPQLVNLSMYHTFYGVNLEEKGLEVLYKTNLARYPRSNPAIPYVIASLNRGRLYKMANSPYHRHQFLQYGVTEDNAFMCGFFYLCSPNVEVQMLYQNFWDKLGHLDVLKIGLQIRLGDGVISSGDHSADAALRMAAPFFSCAEAIEKANAAPGQKITWYLNSDSQALRLAAKNVYGSKLLTDTAKTTHIDCGVGSSKNCSTEAVHAAMRHSVGALLTFSLTDFQIVTAASGFGRLPAWMSGRWNNLYEMWPDGACRRTPRDISAATWAGV